MEKKMKILAFAAVALMFAVCFIGFVAINDGAVDAEGGDSSATTVDKGPLGDMCPDGMTYEKDKQDNYYYYKLTRDVTVTLTADVSMENVKFVGIGNTLTIKSKDGVEKPYTLSVTYDFGKKTGNDAGRIFQVSSFVLEGANLNVTQSDDEKKIEANQPGGSVFGEAQVTVKSGSEMTITTNKNANRVFYNNGSSLTIENGATVILEGATSLTAELHMVKGAELVIKNPLFSAGNFYPNITGGKISVECGVGDHSLFFYGYNDCNLSNVGVLENCTVETKSIVGFYSGGSVDATGTTFKAEKLVAASAKGDAKVIDATLINVTEVGVLSSTATSKLLLENVTFIVNDAAGLKTAVAAGGKISLANDIKIIDCDNTDDKNGLKITKSVEIDGNDKKISFIGDGTIYGLVFSKGCGGSKLSNVSLDFGGFAKYGLCIRNMSERNDITIENVTIDNYGKTGIDLNGVCGEIKLKNVDVKGNGHYVNDDTNLTRGHGYALVIDDIKDGASVTTENCTIASVNVHNFCGKIHDVDLSGCNGLLFVSVEDGSKNTLTSVYDKCIDHKKQTGKDTIVNIEGPSKGLLIDGIISFPTGFDTNKYAIFNTATNINNVDKGDDNRGSFEILRAYRVCYGKAFFDANVKIVGDYTINCDIVIPNDITVTIGKDATLTISDGVKLCNGGTITNDGTISLSSLDVLKESNITSGNVILNGNITINKSDVISGVKLFIGNDANIIVASEITLSVKGTNDTITLVKGAELQFPKDSIFSGTIFGPNGNKLVANGMKAGNDGITITGGSLIINGDIISESGSVAGATVTVTGDGIKISGSLDTNVTMVIEEGTVVTVEDGKTFSSKGTVNNSGVIDNKGIIDNKGTITNDGVLTNDGTIKMTGESNIAGDKKVVNNGVVIDERAKDAIAVPVTNDGTVVAKNNADKYKEAKIDVVEQDPDKPVATEGKIEVNTNKYAFITPVTTTGKLNVVMNDGYKQYTVTIPEGTTIAAGTVISVSFIEYQSDSVTRYQINTPGIENFSMKLPCQIGFKKAKVYCDDSELGVSKVRYDAGTGYVTFDASHNSVFTIVLSNTSHAGTTTVSGGDATNDYSLVIAITVLVASLGFLAYVIRKK